MSNFDKGFVRQQQTQQTRKKKQTMKVTYEVIREAERLPQPLSTIAELLIVYARSLRRDDDFEWMGNQGGVQYVNRPNNFFGITILPKQELLQIWMKNPASVPADVRERMERSCDHSIWNGWAKCFSVTSYEQLPDVLDWMKRAVNMTYRRTHRKAA